MKEIALCHTAAQAAAGASQQLPGLHNPGVALALPKPAAAITTTMHK
jgi:hypothetical protein